MPPHVCETILILVDAALPNVEQPASPPVEPVELPKPAESVKNIEPKATPSDSLVLAAQTLVPVPAGLRGNLVASCLSLTPNAHLEQYYCLPEFSQVLFRVWKEVTGRAVPVETLRVLFGQPLRVLVWHQLGRLMFVRAECDIQQRLLDIIRYLDVQATEHRT